MLFVVVCVRFHWIACAWRLVGAPAGCFERVLAPRLFAAAFRDVGRNEIASRVATVGPATAAAAASVIPGAVRGFDAETGAQPVVGKVG